MMGNLGGKEPIIYLKQWRRTKKIDKNVISAMLIFTKRQPTTNKEDQIQGDPRVPKVNFVGTRGHFLGTRGPRIPVSHLPCVRTFR